MSVSPERAEEDANNLEIRFADEWGEIGRLFDFTRFGNRTPLAEQIATIFSYCGAGKAEVTQIALYDGINRWFEFLDETCSHVRSTQAIDVHCLQAYLVWLGASNQTPTSKLSRYLCIVRLLNWAMRNRAELVSADLTVPFAPFSSKTLVPRQVLSKREIEAVLAAAREEIEVSWREFSTVQAELTVPIPRELQDDVVDATRLGDRRILLETIVVRYAGVVPPRDVLWKSRAGRAIEKAIWRHHGGNDCVSAWLHATPDVLTPYLVILGASLYANPASLLSMTRDCMVEHVLLESRRVITWTKRRAGRIQRRSFLRGRAMSVPNLVEQVLALTAPLVPHAHKRHQNLLFLCRKAGRTGHVGNPFFSSAVELALDRFVKRHGLIADSGGPLHLRLSTLRGTGLGLAHTTFVGDVQKTQSLANHADPSTTVGYINSPSTKEANAALIGRLQTQFVAGIRAGALTHVASAPGPVSLDARHVSASGFSCRDPFAGIAPGQRRGEMCTAWLGCFSCPNAVIPLNANVLARLLAMKEVLLEARRSLAPARWTLVYGPKLEVLERDILPRFPTNVHDAAARMLPQAFHPPMLE